MYRLTFLAPLFSLSLSVTARYGLAALIAFLLAGVAPAAQGAVIVNAVETGGNVVFTGSGTLNLDAWTKRDFDPPFEDFGRIRPTTGVFRVGPVPSIPADLYANPENFMGPSSFGTGGDAFGTSGSGGLLGLIPGGEQLTVPFNYVSGGMVSSSTTYVGQTFASLVMPPGSYTWSWGSGDTADSLTLNVGGEVQEIIQQFCDDVGMDTDDFVDDVDQAKIDLQACFDDLGDCQGSVDSGPSPCLGNFRRCTERANTDKEQACSDFQNDVRGAFDEALADASQQGLADEFLNSPTVQEKISTAQEFGGVCGSPPDEPPAPNAETVCGASFCATDVARANSCDLFLKNCPDVATAEYCVAGGLAICRGIPPLPDEGPPEDSPVCDDELCFLSEARAQECRTDLTNCLNAAFEFNEDECLAAAFLFCRHE